MQSNEKSNTGIGYDRIGNVSPEKYAEGRDKHIYIRMLRKLLSRLTDLKGVAGEGALQSVVDVGSYNIDMISNLNVQKKISIDLVRPLEIPGVQSIVADWLEYDPSVHFDMVCCFQVLEHVEEAGIFAQKLLAQANRLVVVSVPYEWPIGACPSHVHDPVDESKLRAWMGREYDWAFFPVEPNAGVYAKRLIAVYYRDRYEAGADLMRIIDGFNETSSEEVLPPRSADF